MHLLFFQTFNYLLFNVYMYLYHWLQNLSLKKIVSKRKQLSGGLMDQQCASVTLTPMILTTAPLAEWLS